MQTDASGRVMGTLVLRVWLRSEAPASHLIRFVLFPGTNEHLESLQYAHHPHFPPAGPEEKMPPFAKPILEPLAIIDKPHRTHPEFMLRFPAFYHFSFARRNHWQAHRILIDRPNAL